jgi:hypothetical protein
MKTRILIELGRLQRWATETPEQRRKRREWERARRTSAAIAEIGRACDEVWKAPKP